MFKQKSQNLFKYFLWSAHVLQDTVFYSEMDIILKKDVCYLTAQANPADLLIHETQLLSGPSPQTRQ